jgi:hypothetical protein
MRTVSVSPPAQRAAHLVSVTAGRLTSRARMLPAFLIVGAQRCGTTSMYRALSQHPAVAKAVLHKGVHYFDLNYGHSLGWYRAHFPLTARAARATPASQTPVTFESSPYYLFHPLAAGRIAADLPAVKLLVLIRDPVERAYSAWAHEQARGFETESFERALELESGRLAGQAERMAAEPGYVSFGHQHHAYTARGQYVEQLERLEGLVGRDRIHVVDSGDFFARPTAAYDDVLSFLGLCRGRYPEFEQHNARSRSALPDSVGAALTEHFAPYDERLTTWLGWRPSWRR